MDAPTDSTIYLYIQELKRYHVTNLVRACEPTYPKELVEKEGIRVHDLVFSDGKAPPIPIIHSWLGLVSKAFKSGDDKSTIAVHCVSGLGRAPALIAIALIEAGMDPLDSISFIRENRFGAINQQQLTFLESYSRRKKPFKCCIF